MVGLTAYLTYYSFFEIRGWAPPLKGWPSGLSPSNSIPLLLLLGLLGLWLRIRYSKLSLRHISKFRELAQNLLWAGSHFELLTLVDENMAAFSKIYRRDFWCARLRSALLSRASPRFEDFILAIAEKTEVKHLNPVVARFLRPLIRILPAYDTEQQAAVEAAHTVFLSEPFVASLVRSRPYLGLAILELWSSRFEREEFLILYVNELLSYRASVFYMELANNQEMAANDRYVLAPANRLLRFFLSDARVAYSMNIYKPVGDFALAHLDQIRRSPENDSYNQAPEGDFDSRGCWRLPIFAVIRFFDIMVREALFQGIEWHMWLYYLPHIVEKMVRNYNPSDPLVREETDWPVTYNHLIYNAFSAIRDWIKAIEDIPASQGNVVLKSGTSKLQNDNIPKSSILALSQCVRAVLLSGNLREKFKDSLADMAFELFFELRCSENQSAYAGVLGSALRSGGMTITSHDHQYRQLLIDSFQRNKHEYMIKHSEEVVLELEQALGQYRP